MARSKFDGIVEEKNAKGEKVIYVTFQFNKRRYVRKNFTKLFGVTRKEDAATKLSQVKLDISKNQDPFSVPKNTLNEFFDAMVKDRLETKKWKEETAYWNKSFYNKYLRAKIGESKPSKITEKELTDIIKYDLKHLTEETQQQLKKILTPIFKDAIKQGLMFENIAKSLPSAKRTLKDNLDVRALEDVETIVKNLYRAIPFYVSHKKYQRQEMINFYMFILLTAKRVGEVRQIKREHCFLDEKICVTPTGITKTKKSFKFPIPDEVIPYIQTIESGYIFPTISKSTVGFTWANILKLAKISLINDNTVTPHDTRRFFMDVMIDILGEKESVADACLDHEQYSVKRHYHEVKYPAKESAYRKYWEFLRDPYFKFEPYIDPSKNRNAEETKAMIRSGWERYVRKADRMFPDNPHYRKTVE